MRLYHDPFEALLADVVREVAEAMSPEERENLGNPLDIYPDLKYIGVEETTNGRNKSNTR